MPTEDFIISIYCLVEDAYQTVKPKKPLRSRGFAPRLSDSEVITMEIVGEFLGVDSDKGIWRYFSEHWLDYFPQLGSRSSYVKQSANLWVIKQRIQRHLSRSLGAHTSMLYMADGFPIPACHFKRSHFSKLFKGSANYGYCAAKSERYYGFKGNLSIDSQGVITGITFTAANVDERVSLYEVVGDVSGLLIADKGLIGKDYQKSFRRETGINLQTPVRDNMTDHRGKGANRWLISTRRLVETVIGQLTEQFRINKVRARDLWHLTNRISRKVLAHTAAIAVNVALGNPPLQFEKILN